MTLKSFGRKIENLISAYARSRSGSARAMRRIAARP